MGEGSEGFAVEDPPVPPAAAEPPPRLEVRVSRSPSLSTAFWPALHLGSEYSQSKNSPIVSSLDSSPSPTMMEPESKSKSALCSQSQSQSPPCADKGNGHISLVLEVSGVLKGLLRGFERVSGVSYSGVAFEGSHKGDQLITCSGF